MIIYLNQNTWDDNGAEYAEHNEFGWIPHNLFSHIKQWRRKYMAYSWIDGTPNELDTQLISILNFVVIKVGVWTHGINQGKKRWEKPNRL